MVRRGLSVLIATLAVGAAVVTGSGLTATPAFASAPSCRNSGWHNWAGYIFSYQSSWDGTGGIGATVTGYTEKIPTNSNHIACAGWTLRGDNASLDSLLAAFNSSSTRWDQVGVYYAPQLSVPVRYFWQYRDGSTVQTELWGTPGSDDTYRVLISGGTPVCNGTTGNVDVTTWVVSVNGTVPTSANGSGYNIFCDPNSALSVSSAEAQVLGESADPCTAIPGVASNPEYQSNQTYTNGNGTYDLWNIAHSGPIEEIIDPSTGATSPNSHLYADGYSSEMESYSTVPAC